MQPTKYPHQAISCAAGDDYAGGCSSVPPGAMRVPCGGAVRSAAPRGGREAPLDLIEEHLTFDTPSNQYRQGLHGGALVDKWYFPESWKGCKGGENPFILKIQSFSKGGYEATVRQVDLVRIGEAILGGGKRGKREKPEEVSMENQRKAAARSKRKMRHLVKNMMADHLVTFTRRELEGSEFWTSEEWAAAWDRFRRLLTRVLGEFPYVAILEKHKKGNYHLHVAWCGRVNVGLVRKMWLAALGAGAGGGNIDAKHIKVPYGGDRASRIARYISKYVSKHFEEDPRFNKKRYWASRQTLEEARRYVLQADTLDGALREMQGFLGLDMSKYLVLNSGRARFEEFFTFPDGSGLWMAYIPELHGTDPPF